MSKSSNRLFIAASMFGVALIAGIVVLLILYKQFFMPAEGMAPTLAKGDPLVAEMGAVGDVQRGDIIVFQVGDSAYVKRVAGLPGDRVEMRAGILVLNGRPVPQHLLRTETIEGLDGPASARRLSEQFPGEKSAHEIYDLGSSEVDEMAEVKVAPAHLFVLGDNRDRSADSRVQRVDAGVEQLPISAVRGRALFHGLGSSKPFRTSLRP